MDLYDTVKRALFPLGVLFRYLSDSSKLVYDLWRLDAAVLSGADRAQHRREKPQPDEDEINSWVALSKCLMSNRIDALLNASTSAHLWANAFI